MKFVSATTVAALVLGASAIMHSSNVRASLPESNCVQLALECDNGNGNQEACEVYDRGCLGKAAQGSVPMGITAAKSGPKPSHAP
jgi:hypothetical protein